MTGNGREPRRKSESAHEADVLLRLVRKLSEDGVQCRRITVGTISVELMPSRPDRTVAAEERQPSTYAERALDRLGKRLARQGGLRD